MLNEKDYIKQFNQLRSWIRSSVTVFNNDDEKSKLLRIEKASKDLIFFARTYFPHYVESEFAPVHSELFKLSDIHNKPVVLAGCRELAKSTIISFFDELHKTLYKKNKFTIFICDTQETAASEFLLPIRAELEENPRILHDFGEQKTAIWNLEDFITKSGKRFLALGPKMGAKGKKHKASRPDRIIVEDFENINSSRKKSIIKRRLKFLLSDVMKSVSFSNWQFIYIGNYFSKKTIIHQLLTAPEFNYWERRIYPALIEFDKTLILSGQPKIKNLYSIWESRMPVDKLFKEQLEDSLTFRTERMQKPDDEEAIFKEEWIRYFEPDEILPNFPVITYHDPSALKGEEHCYKAIITIAVDVDNVIYYVLDAWIKKTSKWAAVNAHFEISEKYKSALDTVESNGFQASLKEDYELLEQKTKKRLNLKMITNRLPKELRISRLSSLVERGIIRFARPSHSNDIGELLDELKDFPDNEYLDGIDALAGDIEAADTHILKRKNKIHSKVL